MATDVRDQRNGEEIDDERASAERDKGQRNARHGPRGRHDADIDEGLDHYHCRASNSQEETKTIGSAQRDANRTIGQRDEQRNHGQRADETQLLAKNRKNEIGILLGQIEKLCARGSQADTKYSAAAQCKQRLDDVKSGVLRIFPRIDKCKDARAPIGTCQPSARQTVRSQRHVATR